MLVTIMLAGFLFLFQMVYSIDIRTILPADFVNLPYKYAGYLGATLTPEIAVQIIVNPCEGHEAGCCAESYGVMEYFPDFDGAAKYQIDRMCKFEGRIFPVDCLVDEGGQLVSYKTARISDYALYYDSTCIAE